MLAISRPQFEKISSADLATICDWHREHVKVNFPDSKYKRALFYAKLWGNFQVMQLDDRWTILFKAMDKKRMVGFLWLKLERDRFKDLFYCDLHYIQVSPEYRNKGIGIKLMEKAQEWAKKQKCQEIRLGTNVHNKAAIGLYHKCGYKITRVLMEKKICLRKKK